MNGAPLPAPAGQVWARRFKGVVTRVIALVVLPLALLLMLLGLLCNRWRGQGIRRDRVTGRDGRDFQLLTLTIPDTSFWSGLNRSLWYLAIVRGRLSWLGPRPVIAGSYEASLHDSLARVKPGLFGPWWVRERTNIAAGNSEEADRLYATSLNLMTDVRLLPRLLLASLYGRNSQRLLPQVDVLGLRIQNTTQADAIEWILEQADAGTPRQLVFVNPHCVNVAGGDRAYREAVCAGDLVLADGIGMQIAGRLLGTPFRQNVNGTDLFPALCQHEQAGGLRLYLLGGMPGIAERVAGWLAAHAPAVTVAGFRDGYFSVDEEDEVVAGINASGANVLLVAMGVPLQDVWIRRHLPRLRTGVAMGVGGLFDFYSERIPRAPMWMREAGLEWVYRLSQEFGRMWRRYLIGNARFILRVLLARLFSTPGVPGLMPDGTGDDLAVPPARVSVDAAPRAAMIQAAERCRGARRAVILATGWDGEEIAVTGRRPLAMLPLHGTPALQHVLEALVQVGVTRFDFMLCEHPEAIEAHFGQGGRWGVDIRYHLVPDVEQPFSRLRVLRIAPDEPPVWLVDASVLPALPWLHAEAAGRFCADAPAPCPDGLYFTGIGARGWLCLPAAHLGDIARDEASSLDSLARRFDMPRFMTGEAALDFSTPRAFMAAQRQVLDGVFSLLSPGYEVEPGVWLARNVEVHRDARIVAPVQINEDVRIEHGAVVGPYVCIGRGSVIARGTHVVDSLIEADTYVGEALDVHACIVRQQQIYSHEHHVSLNVVDSQLLNAVGRAALLHAIPWRIRLQALLLWLASLLPMQLLRLYLSLGKGCRATTRELVRTPAAEQRESWQVCALTVYEVPHWGLYPRYGWQHYFSFVFPALPQVMRGHLRIIGMPVRGPGEMAALTPDARNLALSIQAGLIDECFVRQGMVVADTHRNAIEHAFVVHTRATYDWGLFLRYMTQLFAPVAFTNAERYATEDVVDD